MQPPRQSCSKYEVELHHMVCLAPGGICYTIKVYFPTSPNRAMPKKALKGVKSPCTLTTFFSGNRLVCLFGHNLEGMISMGFVHHDFITACLHGPYLTWLPSLSAGLGMTNMAVSNED